MSTRRFYYVIEFVSIDGEPIFLFDPHDMNNYYTFSKEMAISFNDPHYAQAYLENLRKLSPEFAEAGGVVTEHALH